MQWDLEGLKIDAIYLEDHPVTGKVELSRVAFGGRVHHTIVLDTPINLYGTPRERVIVEHQTVSRVYSN